MARFLAVPLAAALAALACGFVACKSNSAATDAGASGSTTSCRALLSCCGTLPTMPAVTSCLATATGDDNPACASTLLGLTQVGSCGIALPALDGGRDATMGGAGTGCEALAACCPLLPTVAEGACATTVSMGIAATCAQTLQTVREMDYCGGVATGLDAGGTFSGPSCPAGMPPSTFVPTDASADCVKCVDNCQATNGFEGDCSSYYGCYCACAAGDSSCQQACSPLEGDCMDVEGELESCIQTDCSSLCTTPSTGACASLVQCCQKIDDAGVLGPGGLQGMGKTCAQLADQDGGEATCQAQLTEIQNVAPGGCSGP